MEREDRCPRARRLQVTHWSLKRALVDCYCLVTMNSNAAVIAALEGVPVFSTDPGEPPTPEPRGDAREAGRSFMVILSPAARHAHGATPRPCNPTRVAGPLIVSVILRSTFEGPMRRPRGPSASEPGRLGCSFLVFFECRGRIFPDPPGNGAERPATGGCTHWCREEEQRAYRRCEMAKQRRLRDVLSGPRGWGRVWVTLGS
eukprot:287213-Prorocentrum_minimum.AAC.6